MRPASRRRAAALVLAASLAAWSGAASGGASPLDGAAIEARLGAPVPLDVPLRDEAGRRVRLRDALGGRPLVLVLGYYRCTTLCGTVLESLARAAAEGGTDAALLALSIDPREGPADAARRKAELASRAGDRVAAPWRLWTGDAAAVGAIAAATGFHYRPDPGTGQIAHPAAVAVLTPGGVVSAQLYGAAFDPDVLAGAVATARAGGVAPSREPLLLRCFHWVPALRRFGPAALAFVRAGTLAATAALVIGLALAVRRIRSTP